VRKMKTLRISIKVVPKSSCERIIKKNGIVKVYVKSAPEKGKANKAVIALLAKEYGIKKNMVRIVTGLSSKNKIVEVLKG